MSWSFDFIAESKKAAKAHLGALGGVPPVIVNLACDAIDEYPDDTPIKVKSNGHLGGEWGQNVQLEIYAITMIRAPLQAETTTG